MREHAFEVRDGERRLGIVLADGDTSARARRRAADALVEERVVPRGRLRLVPQAPPNLSTTDDQIWVTQPVVVARFAPPLRKGTLAYLSNWEPSELDRLAHAGLLWTLAGDELPALMSGFHFVNRLEYVACEVPHLGPAMITVL